MDLKIENMDFSLSDENDLVLVGGPEEVIQQILSELFIQKGYIVWDEEAGSKNPIVLNEISDESKIKTFKKEIEAIALKRDEVESVNVLFFKEKNMFEVNMFFNPMLNWSSKKIEIGKNNG